MCIYLFDISISYLDICSVSVIRFTRNVVISVILDVDSRKIYFTVTILFFLSSSLFMSLFLPCESVTFLTDDYKCRVFSYAETNDRNQNDQVPVIRRGFTQ